MSKKSTSINVRGKVFNKDDLLTLIEVVKKLYIHDREIEDIMDVQRLSFSITANDGVSDDFNEKDIDSAPLLLNRKKLLTVKTTYTDLKTDSLIEIALREGNSDTNMITIASSDHEWFNARRAEMQEFIESVEEQKNLYTSHKTILRSIGEFLIGTPFTILLLLIMSLSIPPPNQNPDISTLRWITGIIIIGSINYFVGAIAGYRIFRGLDDLWPNVEFNMGPKHLNKRGQKRKIIKYLVTTVAVPVIITIAIEITKPIFNP